MSKSYRQTMAAMGVIASCFKLLDSHKYISRVDIREMCAKLHMDTYNVLEIWPEEHNDDFKDRMKSILILREWGEYLDRNPDKLKSQTIVFIAGRLKEDLRMITRNKRKLKLLEYLDEPINKLQKYVDATGWHHAACDEGNEMLDFLYDLIEWDWEKMRGVGLCSAV